MKSGISGEDLPQVILSSCTGKQRFKKVIHQQALTTRKRYVGEDAQRMRGVLEIAYPMEHGAVTDWEGLIELMEYSFARLSVDTKERPHMMTKHMETSRAHAEKLTEIMFERFSVPAFFVYPQPVLSLYGTGYFSGIVVDVGDGVTQIVHVFDGYGLEESVFRWDFGGSDVSSYLGRLLGEKGYQFCDGDRHIMEMIKEKMGFLTLDYKRDTKLKEEIDYKLPDGHLIKIGTERFRCGECLFDPSLVGLEAPGVHQLIYETVVKSPIDIRKDCSKYIRLIGGTTLYKGFKERIEKELCDLGLGVDVIAHPERHLLAWKGGSFVAGYSLFCGMWITTPEYAESGPGVVHRKCF
uniref:Uncharacterized protein n=1 Tax=Arcella intermedia TaxID=1963864 RepID=A0A6B2L7Q0_9EUKA